MSTLSSALKAGQHTGHSSGEWLMPVWQPPNQMINSLYQRMSVRISTCGRHLLLFGMVQGPCFTWTRHQLQTSNFSSDTIRFSAFYKGLRLVPRAAYVEEALPNCTGSNCEGNFPVNSLLLQQPSSAALHPDWHLCNLVLQTNKGPSPQCLPGGSQVYCVWYKVHMHMLLMTCWQCPQYTPGFHMGGVSPSPNLCTFADLLSESACRFLPLALASPSPFPPSPTATQTIQLHVLLGMQQVM